MESIKDKLEMADKLLNSSDFNHDVYSKLEAYALKNGSRLSQNADFNELQRLLDAIAEKFNVPSLLSQQENFGLNSCAQ